MGYQIENCTGSPEEVEECANFLASFVADGELETRTEAETRPETYRSRLTSWWNKNPYCKTDSPRGLILRREDGSIGGFFGFIPHDYVSNGEIVPSLISTTTFVRNDCRDASLGLFFRAHKLGNGYHLIDGGPNDKLIPLLERAGYHHADKTKLNFFPVRRLSWRPRSWLVQMARMFTSRVRFDNEGGRFVSAVDEITQIPATNDPALRKHIDKDTLEWYLNCGIKEKHLISWCDKEGSLAGYLLCITRSFFGFSTLFVLDAASFVDEESDEFLGNLAAFAAHNPGSAGIPKDIDLIVWPSLEQNAVKRKTPFSKSHDSKLFYRLPPQLEGIQRHYFPYEGDKILL